MRRIAVALVLIAALIACQPRPPSAARIKQDLIGKSLTYTVDGLNDRQWLIEMEQIKSVKIDRRITMPAVKRDEVAVNVALVDREARLKIRLKLVYILAGRSWTLDTLEVIRGTALYTVTETPPPAGSPEPKKVTAGPMGEVARVALQSVAGQLKAAEMQYLNMNGSFTCQVEDLMVYDGGLVRNPGVSIQINVCTARKLEAELRDVKTGLTLSVNEQVSGDAPGR